MGNAAATFDLRERADVRSVAAERTASIPWYVWCLAAATAADLFGGYWDISWHISIGRDTFWTPAHMMIYLAGVLAGVASGYAILSTTFGSSQEAKDSGISVWGFRGPLGCFMAAWGGFAMLTSAPFDNWWHNAYGLDVKIVSLPHSMLGIGELMIELGAMLLVCAHLNRASGAYQRKLDRLLLSIGGIVVAGSALFILESTPMEFMHNSRFYRAVASRVSRRADRDHGRLEEALAGDHDGRNLHRAFPRGPVDFPAVPRRAQARAGLSEHHAHGSAVVSGAGDRARVRARPPARLDGRELGRLEIGALPPDAFSSRRSLRRSGRSRTS